MADSFRIIRTAISNSLGLKTYEVADFGTPKAAIFYFTGDSGTSISDDFVLCTGFTDGVNSASASISQHSGSPTDAMRDDNVNDPIVAYDGSTVSYRAEFDSWSDNGIILNFTVTETIPRDLTIVLIGGPDVLDAHVGTMLLQDGINTASDIGLRADFIMMLAGKFTGIAPQNDAYFNFGFTNAELDQMSFGVYSRFGQNTGNAIFRQRASTVDGILQVGNGSTDWTGRVTNIHSTSFDVLTDAGTNISTNGERIHFLAISAPDLKFDIKSLAHPIEADTANGVYTVNSFSISPEFCMMLTTDSETISDTDTASVASYDRMSISSFDPFTSSSNSISATSGSGIGDEVKSLSDDIAISQIYTNTLKGPEATLVQFESHGYTLDYSSTFKRAYIALAVGKREIIRPPGSNFRQIRLPVQTVEGSIGYEINGFGRPHAVMVITSNSRIDNDSNSAGYFSIGFTDGVNTRSWGMSSRNLASPTQTVGWASSTHLVDLRDHNGTVYTQASFDGWLENGLSLNYTDTVGTARFMTMIFIGGSDIDSATVESALLNTNDVLYDSLPGEPHLVLMGGIEKLAEVTANLQGGIHLGMATKSTDLVTFPAGFKQSSVNFRDLNAAATSFISTYIQDNVIASSIVDLQSVAQMTISDATDTGFRIKTNGTVIGQYLYFLAISFNKIPEMSVESRFGPNSTGAYSVSDLSFQPSFGMILTTDATETNNLSLDSESFGVSCFDPLSQSHNVQYCADEVVTTKTLNISSDNVIHDISGSTTDLTIATFTGFDANGYSINVTKAPLFARGWVTLSIGEVSSDNNIYGDLNYTTLEDSVSSSGELLYIGSLSEVTAASVLSASGVLNMPTTGDLSEELGDATLSASGTLVTTTVGDLTEVLSDAILLSNGTVIGSGALAEILDDVVGSASGVLLFEGFLSEVLDSDLLEGIGVTTLPTIGNLSERLDDVTLSADGNGLLFGSLSEITDPDTVSATGVSAQPIDGDLSVALEDDTSIIYIIQVWYGDLESTTDDDTLIGTGVLTPFEHVWTEDCKDEENWHEIERGKQSIERCDDVS